MAAAGFGAAAEAYERGRPDYPAAAIDALVERLEIGPGVVVVDLAAGTGHLRLPLDAGIALVGALLWLGSPAALAKGLMCILFIPVTSSTAAHALSRAAHRSGVELWSGSVVDRYAEDREGVVNGGEPLQ